MGRSLSRRPPAWVTTAFSFDHGDNRDIGPLNKAPTFNGNGTHEGTYRNNTTDGGGQSEDYMSVGDDDAFSPTDGAGVDRPFSIGFLFNATAFGSSSSTMLFAKRNYSAGQHEYQSARLTDGRVYLVIYGSGATSTRIQRYTTSTFSAPTGWAHLIITYDGSELSAGVKMYVNGVDDSGSTNDVGTYLGCANSSAPLTFGGWSDPNTTSMVGDWDSPFYANRELTANEVATIYQEGRR